MPKTKCPNAARMDTANVWRRLGCCYPAKNVCCRTNHSYRERDRLMRSQRKAMGEIWTIVDKSALVAEHKTYSACALYLWNNPATRAILDKYGIAVETEAPANDGAT